MIIFTRKKEKIFQSTAARANSISFEIGTACSISAVAGDDTIEVLIGENNFIDGGVGNDSIFNSSGNSTISGGKGNDTILIYHNHWKTYTEHFFENHLIQYAADDGNDTIYGFDSTSTLSISGGSYSTQISGYDINVNVGTNSIKLKNALATADVLHINDENISLEKKVIELTDGKDEIEIYRDSMSVKSGAGNDSVDVGLKAFNSTIEAGAGNDTIKNVADSVSIDGGADDDTIDNYGENVTINGGEGNDFIYNSGDSVTIDGGAGDDSIYNSQFRGYTKNVLFQYTDGDGNDTIYGFDETSTLRIFSDDDFYTVKSSLDIIVYVGDGSINLRYGTLLSEVNIISEKPIWRLNGTTATYGTTDNILVTVEGVNSAEGLSLNGKVVTVAASALNRGTVTISDGYTLQLADDVATPNYTTGNWQVNGTTATYNGASNTAGYELVNNQIVYISASTNGNFTISGVANTRGLSINGKIITVAASSLNQSTVTISNGYSLQLADDVTTPNYTAGNWQVNGTTATYNGASNTAGYELVNNQIVYKTASGGETLITVNGVANTSGLSVSGNVVTVAASSLNQSTVTISNGYSLALADDVATPETTQQPTWTLNGTTAAYGDSVTKAGYAIEGNKIVYKSIGDAKALVELNGIRQNFYPAVEDNKIIFSSNNFDAEEISVVSNENYYEFELAKSDYEVDSKFAGSAEKDTITNNGDEIIIDGGAANDRILNNGTNNTIYGGKGNDIVSLSSSNGGNMFVYSAGDGKDRLINFKSNDTIKIADSSTIEAEVSGKDIVFNVGNGKMKE